MLASAVLNWQPCKLQCQHSHSKASMVFIQLCGVSPVVITSTTVQKRTHACLCSAELATMQIACLHQHSHCKATVVFVQICKGSPVVVTSTTGRNRTHACWCSAELATMQIAFLCQPSHRKATLVFRNIAFAQEGPEACCLNKLSSDRGRACSVSKPLFSAFV